MHKLLSTYYFIIHFYSALCIIDSWMPSNKTSLAIISILSEIRPWNQGESLPPPFLLFCAERADFTSPMRLTAITAALRETPTPTEVRPRRTDVLKD